MKSGIKNLQPLAIILVIIASSWISFELGAEQARTNTILEYIEYFRATASALENAEQLMKETAVLMEKLQDYDCKPKTGVYSRLLM